MGYPTSDITGFNALPISFRGMNYRSDTRPPAISDNKNYLVGSIWEHLIPPVNPSDPNSKPTADIYMFIARHRGNAIWQKFGESEGELTFLTADSGGPVPPDANNNINVLGGTAINTVGVPGTNTITINVDGDVATQYDADAGTAIPALGILNVLGGTSVSTVGAGNTITINADGDLASTYDCDTGSATPAAGILEVFGGTGLATTGAGNTITIDSTAESAFAADIIANILNVTGAGAIFEIPFDRTQFNIGGDFSIVTGIYTAPVDGVYEFNTCVSLQNLSAGMISGLINLEVKGTGPCVGQWSQVRNNPLGTADTTVGAVWRHSGSITVQLDANDTVNVEVSVSGGVGDTATLSIGSGGPPSRTWFSGSKLFDL